MDKYYFKLVCIDEQNPLEYMVLEDEIIGNLEDVHNYVVKHIKSHPPELSKWILIPFKKNELKI